MPRIKNTRPTTIYALLDTRPETIAAGWRDAGGKVFYVGKTVAKPRVRLQKHQHDARRAENPNEHQEKVLACGDHIEIRVIETVPADGDWIAREQRWIKIGRQWEWTRLTNIADGGAGVPGCVPTPEACAKISASKKGKPRSPETIAKVAAAHRGKKHSPETRAKMSAAHTGRKMSPESIENSAAKRRGRILSAERRAQISAATKAAMRSPEVRAKLSAAGKGRKMSPEAIAKRTASVTGKKHKKPRSPEQRARISAATKAAMRSPEVQAKLSAAAVAAIARRPRDEKGRMMRKAAVCFHKSNKADPGEPALRQEHGYRY